MTQQRWLPIIPVALIMYTISYVDRTTIAFNTHRMGMLACVALAFLLPKAGPQNALASPT
jgi:hypothetical protein